MSYEKIVNLQSKLIIGTKQTLKALESDSVEEVFVAKDADAQITKEIIRIANEQNVTCTLVDSKKKLGTACGIEVNATTVAITKSGS